MESSVPRVELNTSPYSYRVLEKSSGVVLVAESGAIAFATNGYTVRSVTDVTRGTGWMKATPHLEGTSEVRGERSEESFQPVNRNRNFVNR
jgi:hypothetical protein